MPLQGRINMRGPHHDMTVSLSHSSHGGRSRWTLGIDPDRPLDYGFEDAGCVLDDQQIRRLLSFLLTGESPDVDADLPDLPEWTRTDERNP